MEKYLGVDKLKRLLAVSRVVEYGDTEQVISMIDELSVSDVKKNVHGNWIKTMEGNGVRRKCSICGYLFNASSEPHKFCGNCVSKMQYEE